MKPNLIHGAAAWAIAAAFGVAACSHTSPYGSRPDVASQQGEQSGAMQSPSMQDPNSRYDTSPTTSGTAPAPSTDEHRNPGSQPPTVY
ncbi:hypothetical protein [Burkholderia ubonensis]|uniref:hypothetical protein n=1 Tax=Burkholderia ubonensis TaxID=101571 RepID=UPI0012FBF0E0|nr:hypothetical protein [Burkholderia ubonensis]